MTTNAVAFFQHEGRKVSLDAAKAVFSPYLCFRFDGGEEDAVCLRLLADHLKTLPDLTVYVGDVLLEHLLAAAPDLAAAIVGLIADDDARIPDAVAHLPRCSSAAVPGDIRRAFLADCRIYPRLQMKKRLPATTQTVEPTILGVIAPKAVPARAWSLLESNIYPIDIPEIRFDENLDFLLLDCPSRNLAMLPNGLGFIHNALKATKTRRQTFDLDIVVYHRFHLHRIYDCGGQIVLPGGRVLPRDPWQAEHYDIWASPEVIDYLMPYIREIVDAIIAAKPKAIGLSIQQCNEHFSRRVINYAKQILTDLTVVVGGFSCYNPDIGRRLFSDCDYMCIGEADLSAGPLIEALARGERPANMPGVISRYDDPATPFIPAPMPHNLDALDFPRYEWFGIDIYRNYNGYQLVPIIASRGCRWSRCSFCAERFYWRICSAANFVNELEWLIRQGCYLYMFNESDLGGMPERVVEICDEIVRRKLKVRLTGQLRIHKKLDREFFDRLRAAGFISLRFGVDAFSENTLRLQKKGYTKDMVSRVLRDCTEAGIYTEVNWVIGIPGETDDDIEEGIDFIIENQKWIGRLANINPLILANGSVYWIDPDTHNVRFRGPKDELYSQYPRAIPAHLWYSLEPYIDANVRKARFEHVAVSLYERGFPIGSWAMRVIEDVRTNSDTARAGRTDVTVDEEGHLLDLEGHLLEKPVPTLSRTLETHAIYYYEGFAYAVPLGMDVNTLDFGRPDRLPAGVLRDLSEDSLVASIADARDWADMRGQYDLRRTKRAVWPAPVMRADSALGDVETGPEETFSLGADDKILPLRDFHVVVGAEAWRRTFGDGAPRLLEAHAEDYYVRFMYELRGYKILGLENRYFAVPVSIDFLKMEMLDEAESLGILTAPSYSAAVAMVLERTGGGELTVPAVDLASVVGGQASGPADMVSKVPVELGFLNGRRIVSYEGWVYGLPPELANVDLLEVDLVGAPGVIRDVSRDVVEGEILELSAAVSAA